MVWSKSPYANCFVKLPYANSFVKILCANCFMQITSYKANCKLLLVNCYLTIQLCKLFILTFIISLFQFKIQFIKPVQFIIYCTIQLISSRLIKSAPWPLGWLHLPLGLLTDVYGQFLPCNNEQDKIQENMRGTRFDPIKYKGLCGN